ncbi:uncharacterized protein LOC6598014 [Drosophila persimilis]|uniref:uncharacterized protein LOC6598014 n=1 Tax=Drosophila persimilis TaxID=7234 RepID=UPI000F091082|nr:uncharacterized protein LOC6598014 [Drosophila persimilis]
MPPPRVVAATFHPIQLALLPAYRLRQLLPICRILTRYMACQPSQEFHIQRMFRHRCPRASIHTPRSHILAIVSIAPRYPQGPPPGHYGTYPGSYAPQQQGGYPNQKPPGW